MAKNLPPTTIYDFIVGDFQDAWESLLRNPEATHRGNFMFGKQAMTLLEWASRLAAADAAGNALATLSQELKQLEPKYFTKLPGPCFDSSEFQLPFDTTVPNLRQHLLLWAIFDLVRNGQAHQYQQILVSLLDGKNFQILLTGAEAGPPTQSSLSYSAPVPMVPGFDHLGFGVDDVDDVYLVVHPDRLFNHVRQAVERSGLLQRGLNFDYLARPRRSNQTGRAKALANPKIPASSYYSFSSSDLREALERGGLVERK